MTAGDLAFLTALNGDPTVMRFVTGRPAPPAETMTEWDRRLTVRSDRARGLGYWLGRVDEVPVGWWGVGFNQVDPAAGELGMRLVQAHWRRGLGLEGARLVLSHAFTTAEVPRVWAGTTRDNTASRATLTRAGLSLVAEPAPGVLTYEINKETWAQL